MSNDPSHRNASGDAARQRTQADDESPTMGELGWTDPPPVPERPGEDLQWKVVDADGTDVLVARCSDESAAWVSMVRPGVSSVSGPVAGE